MVVAFQADGRGVPDLADDLDAGTRLADAEAFAGEDFLVTERMELREALAEFEFLAVYTFT